MTNEALKQGQPPPHMLGRWKWITNLEEGDPFYSKLVRENSRESYIKGTPKGSDTYTSEALTKMGRVGVYVFESDIALDLDAHKEKP